MRPKTQAEAIQKAKATIAETAPRESALVKALSGATPEEARRIHSELGAVRQRHGQAVMDWRDAEAGSW